MFRVIHRIFATALCLGAPAVAVASPALQLTLDASTLTDASAVIAFDLVDHDTLVNDTATIGAVTGDGAYNPATAATSGDVTNALDPVAVPGDSQAFNEPAHLGNAPSFRLTLSNQFSGLGQLDRSTSLLLDPICAALSPTDDPTGACALLAIDLTGRAIAPAVFTPIAAGGAIVGLDAALPEPPVWLRPLLGGSIGRHVLGTTAPRT